MLHQQVQHAVPMGFDGYAPESGAIVLLSSFCRLRPGAQVIDPSQRTGISDLRLYTPIGGRGEDRNYEYAAQSLRLGLWSSSRGALGNT